METIGDYLVQNGIKPSIQRLKIYDFLYKHRNHPTVDIIHTNLSPSMPTLSKTTVYNTLKLFVSKGVARSIIIEDNEVRYDADISTHGHFKCKNCGEVFDFNIDNNMVETLGLVNFKIEEQHIYLKGLCRVCNLN